MAFVHDSGNRFDFKSVKPRIGGRFDKITGEQYRSLSELVKICVNHPKFTLSKFEGVRYD